LLDWIKKEKHLELLAKNIKNRKEFFLPGEGATC